MMPVDDLTIALLQPNVLWEERDANFAHYENLLQQIPQAVDLILLPEMFATGFVPAAAKLSEQEGQIVQEWMKKQAEAYQCAICGTSMVLENGNYVNRFYFVQPDGLVDTYDKRHLFGFGGEKQALSPGSGRVIISYRGWKLFPQICYDIRFPVWERNVWNDTTGYEYDMMLLPVNWPASRIRVLHTLLAARAIENQCYVACTNRIGIDSSNILYNGNSQIVDFKGEVMAQAKESGEDVLISVCSGTKLMQFREAFCTGHDQDSFTIEL